MRRQTRKPETESEEEHSTQSEELTQTERVKLREIGRAFGTINLAEDSNVIKGCLEAKKKSCEWDNLPLSSTYASIIEGIYRKGTPELRPIILSIRMYSLEVLGLPKQKRPDWDTQYKEICKRIIRLPQIKDLFLMSKEHFKPGKAYAWYEKVRNYSTYEKYTWMEIYFSIEGLKWMKTELDDLIKPTEENWQLLEGWCKYVDLLHRFERICNYCKKKGHVVRNCYRARSKMLIRGANVCSE